MENAAIDLATQSAAIIGISAVVGKIVPEKLKNKIMPLVSMIIGVFVVVVPQYVDIAPYMQGIILGGSVTGLYGVAKEIKRPTTQNV